MTELGDYAEIGNIVLTLVVALAGGIWAFRNNTDFLQKELAERMEQNDAQLDNKIYDVRKDGLAVKLEVVGAVEKLTQRYGDGLMALRQKVTDVELWNRDNFATKTELRSATEDFKMLWNQIDRKLDDRFNRLERRLDRLKNGEEE